MKEKLITWFKRDISLKDILMSNVYEKMLNVTIYQGNKFKSKPQ